MLRDRPLESAQALGGTQALMPEPKLVLSPAIQKAIPKAMVSSPVLVYDRDAIEKNCRRIPADLNLSLFFASMASFNKEVLALLSGRGMGFLALRKEDIVNGLKTFKPEKMVLVSKISDKVDFEFALEKGILVNVCSMQAIDDLGSLKPGGDVGLLIEPGVSPPAGTLNHSPTDLKNGFRMGEMESVKERLSRHGLLVRRLTLDLGSAIKDTALYTNALSSLLDVAASFPGLKSISLGGGFDEGFDWNALREPLGSARARLKASGLSDVSFEAEPGRCIVGTAGHLLMRVLEDRGDCLAVNASFSMGRMDIIGKPDIVSSSGLDKPCSREVILVGKSPLRGDVLTAKAHDKDEPVKVRIPAGNAVGDILVWRNAGAYVQAVKNTFLSLEECMF